MQAMAKFIQLTRPNATNFKWIGQQDLPDLAKALKMDPWPGDHGVAIKIGYDLNGQPVEEAFFGVYYISKAGHRRCECRANEHGRRLIATDELGISGAAKHARTGRHARETHADVLCDCQVDVCESGVDPAHQSNQRQDDG